MTTEQKKQISPFFWVEHNNSVSVCMEIDGYLQEIFDRRAEEGCEGNGYDWESLAQVYLQEHKAHLVEKIHFDSEGSMFCAYTDDAEALEEFILGFRKACEDIALMTDLFSRADLF